MSRSTLVSSAGESEQRGGRQSRLLDRGQRVFLEVALKPTSRDPRMATRVFARDQQRQLERVLKAELRQLPRCGQGGDHVTAL
jgi:hypothetical protein